MRLLPRLSLPGGVERSLARRQGVINERSSSEDFSAQGEWQNSRHTAYIGKVLETLIRMTGKYERCMYCCDSHGTDIEHFWPKTPYPEYMFKWENMLLCCTECGRLKGPEFPLSNGVPLLIDPTAEQPWDYLDFDPDIGSITTKYDITNDKHSEKGMQTVETLHLDRREALQAAYRRTYNRLHGVATKFLANQISSEAFWDSLTEYDDHGLIGWIIIGNGKNVSPFKEIREQHPDAWRSCVDRYEAMGRDPEQDEEGEAA